MPICALAITALRRCGSRIVLNRYLQRGNSRVQNFEHVGLAISTARQLFRITGNAFENLLAGMANGHISRRINLLRDGLCAAVIIPGHGIKRCALGFVSREDKATIAIRRVGGFIS